MKKRIWYLVCVLALAIALTLSVVREQVKRAFLKHRIEVAIGAQVQAGVDMRRFSETSGYRDARGYIAHAGGVGEFANIQCLEGVQDAIAKGFVFLELDLLPTSDGHIIAMHDWDTLQQLTGVPALALSRMPQREIQHLKIEGNYTILNGELIRSIMSTNAQIILITDKIQDFDMLLREIPFPDRMIVEVFSAEKYLEALLAGIKYPAFCIQHEGKYDDAVDFDFPLVTVNASNFLPFAKGQQQVEALFDSGKTILLFAGDEFHIDDAEFVKSHLGKTVSKIYTDTWSPMNLP